MEPASMSPAAPIAICTLWEKDFHKGLGSLVNSLVRGGFRGKVWAGYRGDLPPWAAGGREISPEVVALAAGPDVEVLFVRLATTMHFAQYKALWMLEVLNRLDPTAGALFYFDPDVMLLGAWNFFEQWLDYGIAVVEDGSYPLNPTHPLVRGWQAYAKTLGYQDWHFMGAQLNSGMVGLRREHIAFLELWQKLMDDVRRDFHLSESLKTSLRTDLFYASDQDVLTMAFCVSEFPVSYVGPDGMAFGRGEWLTVHAYSPKPWRRRIFRDWIAEGHRPDTALKQYWSLVSEPLAIEPASRVQAHRRWMIPLVALLSRFYNRP
jgi:hypothetical protein